MDIIVVNDTNIFIDLISAGLLDDFFPFADRDTYDGLRA